MNLTKEQIESNVDAFKAWMNGEPIEFQTKVEREWELIDYPTWYKDYCYRRKPIPVERDWTAEDVPPVCWLRHVSWEAVQAAGNERNPTVFLVAEINDDGVLSTFKAPISWRALSQEFKHSTDLRAWHPCKVKEDAK